jgi:endonuclease G
VKYFKIFPAVFILLYAASSFALDFSDLAFKANDAVAQRYPTNTSVAIGKGMSVKRGLPNLGCPQFQAFGFPTVKPLSITNRSYFTCRLGYAGMYDPVEKNPLWIAEHLVKGRMLGDGKRDKLDFSEDPQIPEIDNPQTNSYRKYGDYDTGHMAPAADFGSSMEAMQQTFLYSNAVPQVSSHNQGIWANLEAATREMAERRGELYVVTGPVYTQSSRTKIANGVSVPDAIYKVLIDPVAKTSTAFLIPNKATSEVGEDYMSYQLSVRELEKQTNLNFNSDLGRNSSDKLEVSGGDWVMPKVRIKFKN